MIPNKKLLAFSAMFCPPYIGIVFLGLVPWIFLTIGDAPIHEIPGIVPVLSLSIILVGYLIMSVIEYFVIRHIFAGITFRRTFTGIMFSWILGPVGLGAILFLFWLIMGGFVRFFGV